MCRNYYASKVVHRQASGITRMKTGLVPSVANGTFRSSILLENSFFRTYLRETIVFQRLHTSTIFSQNISVRTRFFNAATSELVRKSVCRRVWVRNDRERSACVPMERVETLMDVPLSASRMRTGSVYLHCTDGPYTPCVAAYWKSWRPNEYAFSIKTAEDVQRAYFEKQLKKSALVP